MRRRVLGKFRGGKVGTRQLGYGASIVEQTALDAFLVFLEGRNFANNTSVARLLPLRNVVVPRRFLKDPGFC